MKHQQKKPYQPNQPQAVAAPVTSWKTAMISMLLSGAVFTIVNMFAGK